MTKRIIFTTLGVIFSVVPAVIAVLSYFPAWCREGGEYVLSGFTTLLLLLAMIPLYKLLRKVLKSPSAWLMWLVAFVAFYLVSNIAEEMVVITFVGFVSNVVGAIFFRIAKVGGVEDGKL